MGDIINLPRAGSPSSRGERSPSPDRANWLRDGIPPGEQNTLLGSHTMWAANLGMSLGDSWAIWRAIMLHPASGPHKRGWTVDTYEYDKHKGSYDSAVSKTSTEAERDSAWSSLNTEDVDPEGLPLGEVGPDGILYDHGLYWLYGSSGHGKTIVAYYIAIARARAGYTVAILDDEMGPNSSARMLRDLGASKGTLGNIKYLQWMDGDTPNLLRSGASLDEFLGVLRADMLIVDCMNAYLSAADLNDNSSNDVRKMLQSAVYPSRKSGRAVLIIDHKGHAKDESRARGSSDKMPGCDMMIGLECPVTFQEDQSGQVILTCDKDRNARVKGKELQIDMHIDGRTIRPSVGGWEKAGDFNPNVTLSPDALKVDALLEAAEYGMRNNEIVQETGLTKGQVSGFLSRGRERGNYQVVDGMWYKVRK